MKQVCRDCQSIYNALKQSVVCPHRPHPKLCKLHDRMNCGNPECNKGEIRLMPNVREEDEDVIREA